MTATCVTDEGVYKLLVVGGGPAGIGVFIRAARTGFLRRLLNPELHGTAKDLTFSTQLGRKQKGVAVLHSGDASTFGSGNLGAYAINSNTFARSLLASILDEKPELDPPESIKSTFLEGVRSHESSKRLEEIGVAPASLVEIGHFLNHVGRCVLKEVAVSAPQSSKCLLSTAVTKYEVLKSGLIRVEAKRTNGSDETVELYTEHLVLATGGVQELPVLDNPAYQAKLFSSDACLRVEGFAKLKEHLLAQPSGERKVCIVGGSHSSFSVAWLLLNKFQDPRTTVVSKPLTNASSPCNPLLASTKECQPEKKREEIESAPAVIPLKSMGVPVIPITPVSADTDVISDSSIAKVKRVPLPSSSESINASPPKVSSAMFKAKDITILHRSPIRCYYGSRKEAEADGADGSRVDRSGCVNTFTGLREDAKRLFKSIKAGRELRVRLFQVNQHGCQTVTAKSYEAASAIVWGAGYKTCVVPGFDADGNPLRFQQSHGTFKLDAKARLQSLSTVTTTKSANVLGIGLGFSLRSAVDEMGSETRADGVTVYHRRGATLVLEALFGPEVYGSSRSFEEMVEKNDKKRLAAVKPERPRNADTGCVSPSKSQSFRSGSVSASNSPTKVTLQVPPAKTATLAPAASTRRSSPQPVSSSAGDKVSKRNKEDAAPTNPPVKLLLLRRRTSVDSGGATSDRSTRPVASPPRCREPSSLTPATDSPVPLPSHVT